MKRRIANILNKGCCRNAISACDVVCFVFVLTVFCEAVSAAVEPTATEGHTATAASVKAAVEELKKLTQQTMEKTSVPGIAIAVVYEDQTLLLQGFGVRQVGKPEAVNADTVFQLASVSKPIATTVLAVLVSKGVICWDDCVTHHDPAFEMHDPWVTRELTLRDLLCHRSGLPDHAGDTVEDLGFDQAEVLHRLRYVKTGGRFRADYAYTNFGFTEAAVAAAKTVGKSWETVAEEQLYEPLGMKTTSSSYQDYAVSSNRAVLHAKVDGKWMSKNIRNADAQSPAGGVSSTVRDLTQWLRLQLGDGKVDGKTLISEIALEETHRPQIISGRVKDPNTDRTGCYGLGWNVNVDDHGRVRLNHSGGFDLGAATFVALVPSEKLGIVVLSNAAPIGVPEALGTTFCDLALDGKSARDWFELFRHGFEELAKPIYGTEVDYRQPPKHGSPSLANAAYVGKYGNDFYGEIEVVEKDGGLELKMGPKQTAYPLRHWDRDVFNYQPTGEMSAGLSGVMFIIGPSQTATQVRIENLDVHGEGTFAKAVADKQAH